MTSLHAAACARAHNITDGRTDGRTSVMKIRCVGGYSPSNGTLTDGCVESVAVCRPQLTTDLCIVVVVVVNSLQRCNNWNVFMIRCLVRINLRVDALVTHSRRRVDKTSKPPSF